MSELSETCLRVLEIENVRKTFRDFWRRPMVEAVKGITFSVNRGEVFGLLGPNGSGKSTTIKLLLGLLRPDEGSLRILGTAPTSQFAHEAIGYLPEITYLHPFLTPRETLTYYGNLFGLGGHVLRERIQDLLTLTGIASVADRKVGTFSKGMTRRVGLAQALINAPRVLILDEPTSGLDPVGTREVKDLILELKARSITVLMSSHLLADVQDCCDRILIMDKGIMRAQGKVKELTTTLEAFFLQTVDQTQRRPPLEAAGGLSWLDAR
ncbi:MAG: ABC transporter ATP-binding protein [Kiritimatiellia bacterium]